MIVDECLINKKNDSKAVYQWLIKMTFCNILIEVIHESSMWSVTKFSFHFKTHHRQVGLIYTVYDSVGWNCIDSW